MGKGLGTGGLVLLLLAASASAQPWHTPLPSPVGAQASAPSATLGAPVVELGRPTPLDDEPASTRSGSSRTLFAETVAPAQGVTPASFQGNAPAAARIVARGQSWDAPGITSAPGPGMAPPPVPVLGAPLPVSMGIPEAPPSPQLMVAAAPPPPDPFYPPPPTTNPVPYGPLPPPPPSDGLFGCPRLGCTSGCSRSMFESDHCFDNFVSPVTNPFLFEDPRALTEVRPVFIYQHTPRSNLPYQGGNLWFLGLRASVAVTERLSFTLNKFGGIWSDPNQGAPLFAPHAGISEIWLGPKWTFWRDDQAGWLGAAGVIFQVPSGPTRVFQDTGRLSVVPYVTIGKEFFRDFHFITTGGYAIGDRRRTDYVYSSFHLDYDVGGLHRIYPLVELNWFHYTKSGNSPFTTGFEGRDLINFGSTSISGRDSLTLAFGARYKFAGSEHFQTGVAMEFPLIASRDLLDFRLTWDVIVRY